MGKGDKLNDTMPKPEHAGSSILLETSTGASSITPPISPSVFATIMKSRGIEMASSENSNATKNEDGSFSTKSQPSQHLPQLPNLLEDSSKPTKQPKKEAPQPPQLGRQIAVQRSSTQSTPGAFSIESSLGSAMDIGIEQEEHREQNVSPVPPDNVPAPITLTAQLVDEDEAEADKKEIDRLKRELEGLRDSRTNPQQTAEGITVAVAEPLSGPSSDLRSSRRNNSNNHVQPVPLRLGSADDTLHKKGGHASATKLPKHKSRLRFSSLGLHGRDNEKKILQDCLCHSKRQLLLIKGHSGTGKTVLASSLKETVLERRGLYVSGKFDLNLRDEPYSGITAACHDICAAIMNLQTSRSRQRSFRELHDKLREKLSSQDIQLLAKVAPGIKEINDFYIEEETNADRIACETSIDDTTAGVTDEAQQEGLDSKNRLHYCFRLFMRIMASYFAPLVIRLDDLQWADAASLELIQLIITDSENPSFLMIGIYRSNEVEDTIDTGLESHLVTRMLQDLNEKQGENGFEMTEMEIGNLEKGAVQAVVLDLLSIDTATSDAIELAEICHKRTLGNAFFLLSFISMLEEEMLLHFDHTTESYGWDSEAIKSQAGATSNMVDMTKQKMAKLPKDFGKLLSVASCLGSSFERSILEAVWSHFADTVDDKEISIEEHLASAVKEGFLGSLDDESSRFAWAHDKIQEAAGLLIPVEENSRFKFRIGQTLQKEMNEKSLDEHIFLVINLLNESSTESLSEPLRLQLAKLNLQATRKAVASSAFSSAAKYASKGIDNLPVDRWTNHYQLSLDLYSSAAESHEVIGKDDAMKTYCDEILQRDCPLLDKVLVYNVLVSQIANSGKHVEAVDLCLEILDSLGCKFPKSTAGRLFATLGGLMKAKMSVQSRTKDEIESLAIMQEPAKIEIMKLLDKLITYSHLCGSDICALAILKSTQLTLKHGVSAVSSPAFASTATIITGALGDLKGGYKMGVYAVQMEEKLQTRSSLSRTKFISGCFAFSWMQPWATACKVLLESYDEGMHSGDTESATFAILTHAFLSGMSGRPLKQIDADCSIFSKQMKELKREQAYDYMLVIWQPALNLMGLGAKDPTAMQGDVLKDFDAFCKAHENNTPMMAMIRSQKLRLFVCFGEYEQGANLFAAHGFDWPEAGPGHPMFMDTIFAGGVCCYAMAALASSRGKRKNYRKLATKARCTLKGWVRQGNPNVLHYEALLDAEKAALAGKKKAAERNYQSSIAIATRLGFIHDAALANERYSNFMLTVLKNQQGAAYHLREAIQLYSEWGAVKKVEQLQQQNDTLLAAA